MKSQKKIIGAVTKYFGREFSFLRGVPVKITAIHKGAAAKGNEEDENYWLLETDEEIEQHGGVTKDDRVEVVPFVEEEGRFSFVSSDPLAGDLELFWRVGERG